MANPLLSLQALIGFRQLLMQALQSPQAVFAGHVDHVKLISMVSPYGHASPLCLQMIPRLSLWKYQLTPVGESNEFMVY